MKGTLAIDAAGRLRRRARPDVVLLVFALVLLAFVLLGLGIGAVDIPLTRIVAIIATQIGVPLPADVPPQSVAVLLSIRLPRIVLGVVAGAGLSSAGAVLQAMFRNPLADPMLIGVSSGAALAVTGTIVLGATVGLPYVSWVGPFALPLAGFVGGLAATTLLYRVATVEGTTSLATMLLAGIAINALAFAGIGVLTTAASNEQLRNISFWNFGNLGGTGWDAVGVVTLAVALGTVALVRMSSGLDALALGESEARHLGFATQRLKRNVIALSALMAGFIVAVCGVIGFVALVAPHIARMLLGVANRRVIPGSALIGASLVVAADALGRSIVAPAELPIGIITALVGGPFFLWLLVRQRRHIA